MFNKDKFLSQLKELVSIDCGTYNPAGVANVVNVIEKMFQDGGFHTKKIVISPVVGPLLVIENKKDASYYDVVLIGHSDTVYNDVSYKDYPMRLEGEKAYGLGVTDMKSGLLVGLHALNNLTKDSLDKLSICFLINPDEEISSIYSEAYMKPYMKKAKCALVLEPCDSRDVIVNKRKGISVLTAKFRGKSAHASLPHKGHSAIDELANFIQKIGKLANPENALTTNMGLISGGSASNVVAEHASLKFEFRFFDESVYKETMQTIKYYVDNPSNKDVKISLEENSYKFPMNNKADSLWLENLVVDTAKEINYPITVIAVGGGSDGNYSSHLGVPTIDGLGPCGDGMHNPLLEFLYLDSVPKRVQLLEKIFLNLITRQTQNI